MTNIPFPNPHDADSLNDYLDALAAGMRVAPENAVEMAAREFHALASRADAVAPQQPTTNVKGSAPMSTSALSAPVSNRTRRQMEVTKPKVSWSWLHATLVAGLIVAMLGSAWLNREPQKSNQNLAWAPGTVPAMTAFDCPVTLPNNVPAPGDLDHYAADGHTWFENGIWITIPTNGTLQIGLEQQDTDPQSDSFGWGFEKLMVLRGEDVEGMVEISGKRLDQESDLAPYNDPATDQFYGDTGFVPIALMVPGEGCWQFTATAGDASATWVLNVEFIEVAWSADSSSTPEMATPAADFIWTQPISPTECPDEATSTYQQATDNPSGTDYTQEGYDQISPSPNYDIAGPADPEDGIGVITRLRESYGCIAVGKSFPMTTARWEYENRTTAGRAALEARADERSEASTLVSSWLQEELGLSQTDMFVDQDPDELTLIGDESLITQGLYNPAYAVEFTDDRIGVIPSSVSYSGFPMEINESNVPGFGLNMIIFVYQDGEWMIDEHLPICIGDCTMPQANVGGDVPPDPSATPED